MCSFSGGGGGGGKGSGLPTDPLLTIIFFLASPLPLADGDTHIHWTSTVTIADMYCISVFCNINKLWFASIIFRDWSSRSGNMVTRDWHSLKQTRHIFMISKGVSCADLEGCPDPLFELSPPEKSNLLNSHCKIPENRTPMENKIIHWEKNYGSAHAVSCPINSVRQYIIWTLPWSTFWKFDRNTVLNRMKRGR